MEEEAGQSITHSGKIYHTNNKTKYFTKLNIDKSSRVEGEDQEYKLQVGGYTGDAGDSMGDSSNNGKKFSTQDRENDITEINCAQYYKGGWWWSE